MKTPNILHHVRCSGTTDETCLNDAVVTIPTAGAVKGWCGEHLYAIHTNGHNVKISANGLTDAEVMLILQLSRQQPERQHVH